MDKSHQHVRTWHVQECVGTCQGVCAKIDRRMTKSRTINKAGYVRVIFDMEE